MINLVSCINVQQKVSPMISPHQTILQNNRQEDSHPVNEDVTSQLVTFNVRGNIVQISFKTLQYFPDDSEFASFLMKSHSILLGDDVSDVIRPINIDEKLIVLPRNVIYLNCILDYFVTGVLHFPHDIPVDVISEELKYFGFKEGHLSQCCWERLLKERQEEKKYNDIVETWKKFDRSQTTTKYTINSVKLKVWNFLEHPMSSKIALMRCVFMGFIVILSVSSLLLESLQFSRIANFATVNQASNLTLGQGQYEHYFLGTDIKGWFIILDFSLGGVIAVEFITRLIVSPEKKQFILSLFTLADTLAMIPLITIPWFYLINPVDFTRPLVQVMTVLYFLRMFRLMRLLELMMHKTNIKIMFVTFRRSMFEMFIIMCLIWALSLIYGAVMFYTELKMDTFFSIFYAQWYAIITMTTVGYGDFSPHTTPGYIIGVLCAFTGIVLVAMTTTILINNLLSTLSAIDRYILLTEGRNDNKKQNI